MLYLFLCSLMMLLCFVEIHKQLFAMLEQGQRSSPLRVFTPFFVASAFNAPMLALMFSIAFADETMISDESSRRIIYILLAGSLGSLALCVFEALKAKARNAMGFWATGRLVILGLAGIVGTMSAYKHLEFFSQENAGWASVGIMREMSQLDDMKECVASIALVQFREAGPLTYRCPTTIILNQMSGEPFIPWPAYVDGTSDQLAAAIQTIKDNAQQAEPAK